MVDMSNYWLVVLALGVGTFCIRFSFILIMDRLTLPDAVHKMLRFIPASVLTALVVPSVLLSKASVSGFGDPKRMIAALVAVFVAWKTKNTLATIGAGMAALWVLQVVM